MIWEVCFFVFFLFMDWRATIFQGPLCAADPCSLNTSGAHNGSRNRFKLHGFTHCVTHFQVFEQKSDQHVCAAVEGSDFFTLRMKITPPQELFLTLYDHYKSSLSIHLHLCNFEPNWMLYSFTGSHKHHQDPSPTTPCVDIHPLCMTHSQHDSNLLK